MFTTTLNNQEVNIHFNGYDSDYDCRIDHYAIKIDLSNKSYKDYQFVRDDLVQRCGSQATCVHGLREQEVIFVFNVQKEKQGIYKPYLLEQALTAVVDDIKESLKELVRLDAPYVIDIGITNAEPEL